MPRPLFRDLDHFELWQLLKSFIYDDGCKVLPHKLYMEITADPKVGRSQSSHFKQLNRVDLLEVLHAILAPYIKQIDEAPMEDVPLLINKEWPCPQLVERLKDRLRKEE